jgi:cytidine deaminase
MKGAGERGAAALAAMQQAYAPYSGFHVGAALLASDGAVSVGCNVENASYPAGLCAERAALATAVTTGHRSFERIVVATDAEEPSPPCGLCRQALIEFSPGMKVVSVTTSGQHAEWALADLLPAAFTPASLKSR